MSIYRRGGLAYRRHLEWKRDSAARRETECRIAGNPNDPADPDTAEANALQVVRLRVELELENLEVGREPDTRTGELFPELVESGRDTAAQDHDTPAHLEPVAAQGGLF